MFHDACLQFDEPLSAPAALRRWRRRAATRIATLATWAAASAVLLTLAHPARAQIQTSGIVYAISEQTGLLTPLPSDGTDLDFFFFPGPPPVDNRLTFEFDVTENPLTGTGLHEIVVGWGGRGDVVILANTALRSEHLVVGDVGEVAGNDRGGTGTFRVNGFNALYNNDPTLTALLPSVLFFPGVWSTLLNDDMSGYDLIIGRGTPTGTIGGTGTVWVEAGGNMEIQDAVLIGNDGGSRGTLVVDGPDSYFGSGGFTGSADNINGNLMVLGRHGIGTMTISNGATVVSEGYAGTAGITDAIANFGAIVGSAPAAPGEVPDAGGLGIVTVTGAPSSIPSPPGVPSRWFLGGSLQLGGFHDPVDLGGGPFDLEGDDVRYSADVGAGILRVDQGGLVSIRETIAPRQPGDPLLLAIGRKGRVELNNGSIAVGDFDRTTDIQLINDGVITGSGRIDTGIFYNRYLGELIVKKGQKMTIAASADVTTVVPGATMLDPIVNYGLIEVTGTVESRAELEFERTMGTTSPLELIQPFINRLLPIQPDPSVPDPSASRGGLITAEHATLRFGSGIYNESRMAFNAGVNIVDGNVLNFGAPEIISGDDDEDFGDFTEILVSGPDTRVVFQDNLGQTGNADINLENGGDIVVLNDFASDGSEISIELSRNNPSTFTVLGDVGLNFVEFNLKFASDTFPLQHGDAFEIMNFGGSIGSAVVTTDATGQIIVSPFIDATNPAAQPSIIEISVSPDFSLLFPDLDVIIQFADEGIYALLLDASMVGMGAVGPDFNGDGVIDLLDLAIWQANQGCMAGCSVLQGDADGDGDVDGDDLLFWQRNVGMPPPWTGAGAGSGSGLGASVPEPAGLGLMLAGGLLALAYRRSPRSARSQTRI